MTRTFAPAASTAAPPATSSDWRPAFHVIVARLRHLAADPRRATALPGTRAEASALWDDPEEDEGPQDGPDDPTEDASDHESGLLDGPEIDSWALDLTLSPPPAHLHRPALSHVLAALHLVRAVQPLSRLHAPRALTLIPVGGAVQLSALADVVTNAVLPPRLHMVTGGAQSVPGLHPIFFLLKPLDDSAGAQKAFVQSVRGILLSDQPGLILLPDGTRLPPDLARILPAPVTLPPLDRAGLLAILQAMFPDHRRDRLARALSALPQGADLAALSPEALGLAFREAAPAAVIAAVARLCGPGSKAPTSPAKPRLDQFDPEQPAVQTARRTVADLAAWRDGRLSWQDIPNGLLLHGPPGTGKTLLAEAMAAEAGVPVIAATMARWQEDATLGPMLARMQASFAEARRAAPCVFFIDEIDAIGTRAERNHNSSYGDQVMAAFLLAVTALREVEGVVLVGATNRLAGIDPALLRPGRFDLKLPLDLPSRAGIQAMLATLLADEKVSARAQRRLALLALGRSPAEIAGALRSARAACRAAGRRLTEAAIAQALTGGEEPSPDLHWRIALHEAGHAVVGIRLGLQIERITATPFGGHVQWRPRRQEGLAGDFAARIAVQLAGRAAEDLFLAAPSAGAGGGETSDLAQATDLATSLELQSGLGTAGLLWWRDPERALQLSPRVQTRVTTHLETGLATATEVIRQMPHLVRALAEVLLAEGELSGKTLALWVTTIRSFDPETRNHTRVVSFPGGPRGRTRRPEPTPSR